MSLSPSLNLASLPSRHCLSCHCLCFSVILCLFLCLVLSLTLHFLVSLYLHQIMISMLCYLFLLLPKQWAMGSWVRRGLSVPFDYCCDCVLPDILSSNLWSNYMFSFLIIIWFLLIIIYVGITPILIEESHRSPTRALSLCVPLWQEGQKSGSLTEIRSVSVKWTCWVVISDMHSQNKCV